MLLDGIVRQSTTSLTLDPLCFRLNPSVYRWSDDCSPHPPVPKRRNELNVDEITTRIKSGVHTSFYNDVWLVLNVILIEISHSFLRLSFDTSFYLIASLCAFLLQHFTHLAAHFSHFAKPFRWSQRGTTTKRINRLMSAPSQLTIIGEDWLLSQWRVKREHRSRSQLRRMLVLSLDVAGKVTCQSSVDSCK